MYSLEDPSSPDRHHRSPLGAPLFTVSILGEAKCYDAVQRLVFREAELTPFLLELGWCLWMLNSPVCKTVKRSQRWHLYVRTSVFNYFSELAILLLFTAPDNLQPHSLAWSFSSWWLNHGSVLQEPRFIMMSLKRKKIFSTWSCLCFSVQWRMTKRQDKKIPKKWLMQEI